MKYVPSISPEGLIQILNGQGIFGETRRRHAHAKTSSGLLKPAPDAAYKAADEELRSELCSWIDAWLDTARNRETGREVPTRRRLTKINERKAREAYRVWRTYIKAHPPDIDLQVHGEDPGNEDEGDEENIREETANVVFAIPTPLRPAGNDDPEEDALKEARRILAAVMASDWKHTIAKCRYAPCQKYFQLKTNRRSYTHGTFCCKAHNGSNTAAAKTKARRTYRKETLLSVAAQSLNIWSAKSREYQHGHPQKHYLLEHVNKFIGEAKDRNLTRDPVKLAWITRNLAEIAKRARGLGA